MPREGFWDAKALRSEKPLAEMIVGIAGCWEDTV